jgi:hypothetical protein
MEEHLIKNKLNKIQALVLRGEAGEQENAIVLMEKFLKEYNLSLEDLTNTEQVKAVKLPYADDFERRILMQIYGKVLNTDKVQVINKEGNIVFLLTRFQEEQMRDLFRVYSKAWKEEVEMFFSAFVQKNEIFPETPPESDTPDDFESLTKLVNMMRTVKKVGNPEHENLLTEL